MDKQPGSNIGKPHPPYNPLEKRRLAESIVRELLGHDVHPLPPTESFPGAGIYVIYYRGGFPLYRPLAQANAKSWRQPIYVGKAAPPGGRKGSEFSEEPPQEPALFRRLDEHAESIRQTRNLALDDFRCRHLVVDEVWIRLAESLLLDSFKPLWNVVVDGFGNHDPGAGRHMGKRPNWDTVHPGRAWAARLQPSALTLDELKPRIADYMAQLRTSLPA